MTHRIAAFFMSYLLMSPAFAAADTAVLEHTEAAVEQTPTETHAEAVVDAAHAAPHGAEGGGMLPQFNVETFPTQVFWLFIMFAITYTLVKTVIIPQIGGTMDKREEHINRELEAATVLTEQVRAGQADYETTIWNARNNALAKLAAARHEITKRFTYAEAAQREEFQAAREEVQNRIAASKETVIASLETEARELATSLSDKLISANSATKKAAA